MSPGVVRKLVENMESGIACCGLFKHEFVASRLCVRQIQISPSCSSRCFIVKPSRCISTVSLRDIKFQFCRSRFSTWASLSPDRAALDDEAAETSTPKSSRSSDDPKASRNGAASEDPDPAPKMTVIVFDLETTGFRAAGDRIIEFAARDLAGGDCSTISALVNPGQTVPYFITAVTGITNRMVNQPNIPSWKEVGPAIIQFTEKRRKGDEPVILVAHNGKRFDVPFLLKEFQSCSVQVPDWWLFLDSMPLARETKKRFGYSWRSLKLSDIHKAYGLQSVGRAHRAMADVNMLASVLEVIVSELELPASEFLDKAFTAEEVYASSKIFQGKDAGDLAAESPPPPGLIEEDTAPWECDKGIELETAVDEVEEQMVLEGEMDGIEVFEMNGFVLDTGSVDTTVLSSILASYVDAKRKRPTFLHLLKVGNFYEALFEDAMTLSRVCKVRLGTVENAEVEVPVARFPACKFQMYTKALLDREIGVVKISDEIKEGASVLTPGMLLDELVVAETRNNYLIAVNMPSDASWGIAFCDLATGDFFATQSEGLPALIEEIGRLKPREAVLNSKARIELENAGLRFMTHESSEFSPVSNDALLLPFVGQNTVDSIRQWSFADCAAGALLRYVQQIQTFPLDDLSLRQLLLYRTGDYLRLDDTVRSYLEIIESPRADNTGSVLWAMDETKSTMGARLLRQWMSHPLRNLDQILSRQNAVEILVKNGPMREALRSCLSKIVDIASLSGRIARQSALTWDDLLPLGESLLVIPRIFQIVRRLPDNAYFTAAVQHEALVEKLAEEMQMVRNSEADSETDEPSDELLENIRKKIAGSILVLQETGSGLAAIDVLCSFAEVAATRDFCKPDLASDGRQISVSDGRHPVVEVHEDFHPTSCFLGSENRSDVIIVTGGKGSGKTRYLQQIGLIQILAQIGSFVPAKQARMSITDRICSVELPDSNKMLDKLSTNSLVLLDDFRVGTGLRETESAMLRAVVEFLANHVNARAMIATECYRGDLNLDFQNELGNVAVCHFDSKHQLGPGLAAPGDGFPSGEYPDWIRKRAMELLGKNSIGSSDDAGDDAAAAADDDVQGADQGNLWHKIMSFTKAKTTTTMASSNVSSKIKDSALESTREDLEQLWQQVSTVLQNSPATLALATQKGSLLSISRTSQPAIVTIGSSPLFVRKFQQDEHAAALEAAFESLLNRPVKLQILVED